MFSVKRDIIFFVPDVPTLRQIYVWAWAQRLNRQTNALYWIFSVCRTQLHNCFGTTMHGSYVFVCIVCVSRIECYWPIDRPNNMMPIILENTLWPLHIYNRNLLISVMWPESIYRRIGYQTHVESLLSTKKRLLCDFDGVVSFPLHSRRETPNDMYTHRITNVSSYA